MSEEKIVQIRQGIEDEIKAINSFQELETFRLRYLGRKGVIADLTGAIPSLPQNQRRDFGQKVNELKNYILEIIRSKEKILQEGTSQLSQGQAKLNLGLPGIAQELGRLHPLTQVIDEICYVFERLGFSIEEGPEVETEYNNFTGLNIPLEHPSRDAFDTFYLDNHAVLTKEKKSHKLLLRSHTSPAQVRLMQSRRPPLAAVVPGRVYRPDAVDASHSFMFHQIEGLLVDEGVRFSDLKGILEVFVKAVFGQETKMRFRPHFFPFTEPSAEVDISCIICKGKGCSVCGKKGWLEILGSGMVHPNVFRKVGYDPHKYSGFAFGMGIERIAMLKFGINDIRLFFENDLRFLQQF